MTDICNREKIFIVLIVLFYIGDIYNEWTMHSVVFKPVLACGPAYVLSHSVSASKLTNAWFVQYKPTSDKKRDSLCNGRGL